MNKQAIDFIGTPELIARICQEAQRQKLRSSQPSRLESAADVLDAPLNPDDVSHILEITKLVFETGIAALGFLSAAVGLFKTGHSKERLLLKDSRTGKTLGNLSPDTSPDEIRRMLGID